MDTKKRILLVSSGFYPEISPRSFRAAELAAEFVRQGHKVAVHTKNREFDYTEFLNCVQGDSTKHFTWLKITPCG